MDQLQLSGFELIEKIGEGGMGQVWKARQISLDRIVAIKLLPPRVSHDPESVRLIIKEARTAAKLKHPGIVQVYDSGEQEGSFFFVMEYVNGYTVGQWVSRKKMLEAKDALVVVESVASALDYAWNQAGLIHCDLKPENIMVDHDGTIKVADLGLSLTKDSQVAEDSDEVAGTPGYISPEQVTGLTPLDCRTDIYALGCCLYQMVTGRRPFGELTDQQAMEAQVTLQIPDPRDIVPGMPPQLCALIERMLVKDREHRIKDWAAVVADIHRVQKGMMPSGRTPDEGASTMKGRHFAGVHGNGDDPDQEGRKTGSGPGMVTKLVLGSVVFTACVALGLWYSLRQPASDEVELILAPPNPNISLGDPSVLEPHPDVPAIPVGKGRSSVSDLAAANAEIEKVMGRVADGGAPDEAVGWLENYSGPCVTETASNRTAKIQVLRLKIAELKALRQDNEAWDSLINGVADSILAGKFAAARKQVEGANNDASFNKHRDDLLAISKILTGFVSLNDRIVESFERDIGKTIRIKLLRGELIGKVQEIRDRKVVIKTLDGAAQIDVRLEDMAASERLSRLATINLPEVFLASGLVAFNEKREADALDLFDKTGPVLGPVLEAHIRRDAEVVIKAAMAADKALVAFCQLMKMAGVEPSGTDFQVWRKGLEVCQMPRDAAIQIDRGLETFLDVHGQSPFVQRNSDLILALQGACGRALEQVISPRNGSSLRPVANPGETDVQKPVARLATTGVTADDIASALMARNPNMDPGAVEVGSAEKNGGISVRIVSRKLNDIRPLAGFKTITSLIIDSGTDRSAVELDASVVAALPLKRLSLRGFVLDNPAKLKGMKLQHLEIPRTDLKILSILSGMPLTTLDISGSGVTELNGLQGMKLESLNVANTKVASVMPLCGMPIRELNLRATMVRDVSYLQGLPLARLDLAETAIHDYSALKGFKLTSLDLSETPIRDLSFCADMPLSRLVLRSTTIPSLFPIKDKTLSQLVIGNANIRDYSTLKYITIGALDFSGSKMTQQGLAAALAQVQCESLDLSNTALERLECIKGNKALKTLNISNTQVSDLTALMSLSVETLNIQGTPMEEVSILYTLKSLRHLGTSIDLELIQGVIEALPDLETVNGVRISVLLEQIEKKKKPNRGGRLPPVRRRFQ